MRPAVSSAASGLLAGAVLGCWVLGGAVCGRGEVAAPPTAGPGGFVPPLNDAVVGETVRIRRGTTLWTWRVSHASDGEVQVEFVETAESGPAAAGPPAPAQALVWPRNGFGLPDGFVVRRIVPDRIDVAGRSWECWRLQCHARSGVRYYWVTDEVPVHGVLRIAPDLDNDGAPDVGSQADLVDFERP